MRSAVATALRMAAREAGRGAQRHNPNALTATQLRSQARAARRGVSFEITAEEAAAEELEQQQAKAALATAREMITLAFEARRAAEDAEREAMRARYLAAERHYEEQQAQKRERARRAATEQQMPYGYAIELTAEERTALEDLVNELGPGGAAEQLRRASASYVESVIERPGDRVHGGVRRALSEQ